MGIVTFTVRCVYCGRIATLLFGFCGLTRIPHYCPDAPIVVRYPTGGWISFVLTVSFTYVLVSVTQFVPVVIAGWYRLLDADRGPRWTAPRLAQDMRPQTRFGLDRRFCRLRIAP